MMPIHELLSRIRWDPEFGRGRFEIAYYDRQQATLQKAALRAVTFPENKRRVFELRDDSGDARQIPLHRIREVYKDGQVIWRRPA